MTSEEKQAEFKKCYETCDLMLRAFGAKTSALLQGQVLSEPEDLEKYAQAALSITEEIVRQVVKGVALRKEIENPLILGV